MSERIEHRYSRLLEVRLLHHYWLDDGATLFDALPDEEKERRLISYDISSFLNVNPTAQAEKALKAFGAIWRNTKQGFVVAVPDEAIVPPETVLEWMLTPASSDFFNYTALTFRPQKIHECYTGDKNTRYRFKENTPVFSNLTGASRGNGESKTLFLSREIAQLAPEDQVEALFEANGALCQLTADQTGSPPSSQTLNADKSTMPIFANQRDLQDIKPPEGVTDAPAKGIQLDDDMPGELFALIRLAARRRDDNDFSFIDSEDKPLTRCPIYELRFKNRHTWWKWIAHNRSESLSTEPLPLTFHGNAAGTNGKKPSSGMVKADLNEQKAVSRLVCEIFI